MKKIKLTNTNLYVLVDDNDYERCTCFLWSKKQGKQVHGYVEGRIIELANFIKCTEGQYDHKNRNYLDHQKDNLRLCNQSQNIANRSKCLQKTSSKYKGVTLRKRDGLYVASIKVKQKSIHLLSTNNEEEAARAYNKAAKLHFGEFAVLNNFNENASLQ
jgi:hypothetical protein